MAKLSNIRKYENVKLELANIIMYSIIIIIIIIYCKKIISLNQFASFDLLIYYFTLRECKNSLKTNTIVANG